MATGGVAGFAPPGWPDGVPGPGAPGWEDAVGRWLLDHAPPEWRASTGLRRHLPALAWLTREHLRAHLTAARTTWTDLPHAGADPGEHATISDAVRGVGPQLAADTRAAELVYQAVQGDRFIPRL